MASKKQHTMEIQRDKLLSPEGPQLATLRRPVAVVKKRSGPLDGVLDELHQMANATTASTSSVVLSRPEESSTKPSTAGRAFDKSFRRRCSTKEKDKEKKRERWLLTRKTWRYMTDAGRKLIPEGLQHEDLPLIEAQFQRVCATEPRFILWRRKSSFPGATKGSRRRFRLLPRHSTHGQQAPHGGDQEDQDNADQTIELLQAYLKLRDAYKTTALLGTKTIRPDQTASPSSQRPLGKAAAAPAAVSQQQQQQLAEAELLTRLSTLAQSSMLGGLSTHLSSITPAILQDKALLKKIYNLLKKQQLHRILHSTEPAKKTFNLGRAASLSSLENTSKKNYILKNPNAYHELNQPADITKRQRKPPDSLALAPNLACARALGTLGAPGSSLTSAKSTRNREKSFSNCGTQTNFVQLCEIKRLAEVYKEEKRHELMLENGGNNHDTNGNGNGHLMASEEEENDSLSRRKSSIDNEDVSQSVSDTIKRYLRMARKKSVHDADAVNRFKRVNYDRNLRNIRAKGEINPPGMDEELSKAVQTLDAWPLIALDFIRGNENSLTLQNAHIEWQKALDERINKKLEWEQKEQEKQQRSERERDASQFKNNAPYICTSAPTSPTNPKSHHYTKERERAGKSGSGGSLLTSGSQFLSNIWHGSTSQAAINQYGKSGNSETHMSTKNESNMQKSKSLSNVGQFVSRKIWRNRSKSQNRPNYDQHFLSAQSHKWSPTDNCTWISEHGESFQIGETSLEKLSDTEATYLFHIAVNKIKELNLGVNKDFERKSQKRRIVQKKKALTTSFFDIGKKDDHNGRDILFGASLECCLAKDRKREMDLHCDSNNSTGSKHSLMSVFRNSVNSSGGGGTKLNDNVRSYESLPSKDMGLNGPSERSSFTDYFTNLKKSSSMQISRSQSDMRHEELELDFNNANHRPATDADVKLSADLNVPIFIKSCICYLEEHGLEKVGLFRVSTSKKRVKQLREDFDKNCAMSIPHNTCPHDIATLLKEFLRDLPEPLLCKSLYSTFLETQRIRNRRLQLEGISHLIKLLPITHRDTLFVLLKFLAKVAAHSDDIHNIDGSVHMVGNKMDSSNLATVFAPNILRETVLKSAENREQEHMNDAINVIRTMIDHYEEIFKVPGEIIDVIYSQMLDECPEALFALITSKSNQSECSDVGQAIQSPSADYSDEVFDDSARYIQQSNAAGKFQKHQEPSPYVSSKQLCEERRQSTPIVLDICSGSNMNVFSASLQISIPDQYSTKPTVSEPKLPASISNIGGATLTAKTAEFERNASKGLISPNANISPTQTVPRKPLYKRQQLIPSSKRTNN